MPISSLNSFDRAASTLFEGTLSGKGYMARKCSKFLNKQFDKAVNDPAKFASSMLLTSIVSKDVVGWILYTYQSWCNKRIPEEKRKSVAALDFINGLIMVGGQILVGKVIEKRLTPGLFGKLYSGFIKDKDTNVKTEIKGYAAKASSRLYEDNIMTTVIDEIKVNKNVDISKVDTSKVAKALIKEVGQGSKRYKLFEAGFGIIVTALATTALVKRTLAPLISTPLSDWFKRKYIDKKGAYQEQKFEAKPEDKFERVTETTYTPWAHNVDNNKNDLNKDQFNKTVKKES